MSPIYTTFTNSKTYSFLNIRNLIILGQCAAPRIGWQIDPFGHSSENARLFKWLGFDGLFFARNDYREKEQMMANKSLDLIWNAGETLPGLSKYYFLYTQPINEFIICFHRFVS